MDNQIEFDLNVSDPPASHSSIKKLEVSLSTSQPECVIKTKPSWWEHIHLGKITLFIASLYLFVLAISLMKIGARSLLPLINDWFSVANGANCLGFGWIFSYLIFSGSPVAAAALTFFDAGAIEKLGAFTMITGSRLGASFIVLFIGFLYVLRGRDRATSLSMGLLSLTVTATTYIPCLFVGLLLLSTGVLDSFQLGTGVLLRSSIEQAVEPVASLTVRLIPNQLIFFCGLGIILISFNLFDKCLPQIQIKKSKLGNVSRLLYSPFVMFILGALVTLISMSVSLSLSLLVPLSDRGYVRRENIIPYIMGANITTFIDTLLAAVLLNNPPAFTIVFVEMISVTIISIIILTVFYKYYQWGIFNLLNGVVANNRNLAFFMLSILLIPVILIFI